MAPILLSCCSTADLTAEHLRERNIAHVCFTIRWTAGNIRMTWDSPCRLTNFIRLWPAGAGNQNIARFNTEEFICVFYAFS